MEKLRIAAEQGDANAQCELGQRYLWGNGGASVDKVESARWYRKAAEQGIVKAQRQLADYYKNDEGVTKDVVEAVKWYRKAAEQWDDDAMNSLGECYAKGEGVAKDPVVAVRWFRKAAEFKTFQPGDIVPGAYVDNGTHNNQSAQNNLGICYMKGEGVVKNPVEAVKWFRKAAEQGNSDAQNNLGVCYANGEGVAKDTVEATRLFRKADNDPIARFNLDCCIKGENVAKDAAEAMQRTRKAAEKGDAAAQFNLGCFYRGVDVAEVIRWWRKAAEQGDAEAQRALGYCYRTGQGVPKNDAEAVKWYRKAVDQGHAKAQRDLGDLYKDGEGVTKDTAEAVKWYRRAAEQGLAWAQRDLGECYEKGEGVAKDETEAARWYRKAAEQGDFSAKFNLDRLQDPFPGDSIEKLLKCAEQKGRWASLAQLYLGLRYYEGDGVAKDPVEAVRWFRKSAEQGSVDAQSLLADCYKNGEGVAKDEEEAAKWYRGVVEHWQRLAATGDVFAQLALGNCYAFGTGVAKDPAEAAKWYRKVAEQGFASAQFNLGRFYANGEGVAKDPVEAVKWYRKAAEQGFASAQCNLGYYYDHGAGVDKDPAEATKWYRKAAEQGYANAQYNLGNCHAKGEGVAKDPVEAVKWYRKAAEQGHASAQCNLGVFFLNGEGVAKNYVAAYMWSNLSAGQGDEIAKKTLAITERLMTQEQIAEAQRLSVAFKPRKVVEPSASVSKESITESRPSGSGTGFFITEDGFLVTNLHVVKDTTIIRLVTDAGIIAAKVVKLDAANDLAVLKAEGRFAALPVAPSRGMKLGESVATVGFPNIGLQGFAPKLAKGEIASLTGAQDDARQFQISVPVQPGNSGGALVDSRGNVVGVVVGKLSQKAALAASGQLAENVNYAVKSSFLLSFLESLPEVSSKLKEPSTTERKFEDVVKSVEQAAVLVLVY